MSATRADDDASRPIDPEREPLATVTFEIDRRGGRGDAGALRVERAIERTPGVHDADASFRTGTVRVTYDEDATSVDALREGLREHGVGVRDSTDIGEQADEGPGGAATRSDLRVEAAFVAVTLAGMVVGLVSGPLDAPAAVRWVGYGAAYVFGGWYGLVNGLQTLRHWSVDIDLLMIVAAAGALSIGAPFEGAMLLFLFSLSNTLQHYAIGRSRRAIRSLVEMRPESAQVLRDGEEVTVPVDEVAVGDVFVVRPGDRIALDGVVVDGESTVDQSSLTGESVPVPKGPDDEVFGGTINESGSLEIEVTRAAEESAITRLIHMVEEAQSEKAPTQRLIDRLEQPYVLSVFGMTFAAIGVPLVVFDAAFEPTFYRAMTLMVAASPCAVVISTPAAVLSAIAAAGRQGVLFKGGEHVETAATIDAVAFDKTGTLTEGDTQLTDVVVRDDLSTDGRDTAAGDERLTEDDLLGLVAAVQARSEHHLARATVDGAEERGLDVPEARGFHAVAGKGVRATVEGVTGAGGTAPGAAEADPTVHIGNRSYFETVLGDRSVDGIESGLDRLETLESEGKTSVLVARETDEDVRVLGWLAYTDTVRPGAAEMIERLRELGIGHVVMLTGDNERVAERIAEEVGIDEVQAELLPEEKVTTVEELVERHEGVAMVGDGVNDAPALATADLGVAMGGAGTDVALETADVVLMGDDIGKVPYVVGLGRKTRRTLTVNLAIAFGAIALMVGTILLRGIPLPLAVVGHEGSTVVVSLNGLRLLAFRE
jgi:Cd2+/Zn2+-exporting ATPase